LLDDRKEEGEIDDMHFTDLKSYAEFMYFLSAPFLVYFAWRMLGQLKIGSDQVKAASDQIITSRKISDIHAKRESLKIAVEQTAFFADKIIPEIDKFLKLKKANKYPILSCAVITENWPDIQCQTNDFNGLLAEVFSNDGLAVKTLNRIEGFSMFFTCGIADANAAYRPLCTSFCKYVKYFLPFIIIKNEQSNQFSNTLKLYVSWASRNHSENTQKEISKHKDHLSKIKVPELKTFGSDLNCS
jgi:hypothetical protein